MVIVLEVQSGALSGKSIRVPMGRPVKVGRSAQSDIAFARDSYISSAHFSLECDDTTCSINDLNSRNGTFVNGERVQKASLHDGDAILAGCTLLAVRLYADDSAPPVADLEQGAPAGDSGVLAGFGPPTAEAERPGLAVRAPQNPLLKSSG